MRKIIILGVLLVMMGCGTNYIIKVETVPPKQYLEVYFDDEFYGMTAADGEFVFRSRKINNEIKPLLLVKKGKYTAYTELEINADAIEGHPELYRSKNLFSIDRFDEMEHALTDSIYENMIAYKIIFSTRDEILEPPKYGYLNLTSNVQRLDVYLDDDFVGQISSGAFNKRIKTGDHLVMVKKRFYSPKTIKANIYENSVFSYHFEMVKSTDWEFETETPEEELIPLAKGTITLGTERNDLMVYIEGIAKKPPFELKNIPAGVYELRIVGPGIDEIIGVVVDADKHSFIDLDLLFPE